MNYWTDASPWKVPEIVDGFEKRSGSTFRDGFGTNCRVRRWVIVDNQEKYVRTGTVQRAFELAQSGKLGSIQEIAAKLKQEDFDAVDAHLGGPLIKQQLKSVMQQIQPVQS